jgi:arginyl-tRNA synthetase
MSFDPVAILNERFAAAIAAAFPDSAGADPQVTASKNPKFGDFQCNAAMSLAKTLGKPPREVAQAIAAKVTLDDIADGLTPASIAGPGFINVMLRPEAIAGLVNAFDTPALGVEAVGTGQTVVVDLCGVNLAKQMHVGHIRATFIGDALARTFERLGYSVKRQNHLGDWGLNIAMVVAKLVTMQRAGRDVAGLNLDQIEKLYKDAQRECDADEKGLTAVQKFKLGPKAEAELGEQVAGAREALGFAKQTLVQLQAHEPNVYGLWKRVADVTMSECLAICAKMGVNVTAEHSAGESSYAEELGPMVDDLVKRGVAELDQGALVVRVEGIEEPCLIRKSDGGFLYATTDVCAIRRRVQKLHASRVIYCVDIRQSLHFKQVFGAAHKAGYTKIGAGTATLEHAGFGTILGEDGRPFKTRAGKSVKLADLVDEAIERADRAIDEGDREQASEQFTAEERASIAQAVGIAALKYTDLSGDRAKDYMFSFDRMLAFEGNTGPYLLYALVRTKNIRRKAAAAGIKQSAFERAQIGLGAAEEKALALLLLRFPGVVKSVGETLEPHRMCQYLYDLSGAYSTFYNACHVLNAPDEATKHSRLRLCLLCERVLEDGLHMLGIRTVERM